MRTWWICRYATSGELDIVHSHFGMEIELYVEGLPIIGPYWSHEEAQRVLEFWTK
jgi:hypothetical protein